MRWAASDVSPSSHLAFHIPTLAGFCLLFVLCSCLVLLLWCVFGFLFCECLGIPNSPRSLDLDDRQGLIARSAMQQKKNLLFTNSLPLYHVYIPYSVLPSFPRATSSRVYTLWHMAQSLKPSLWPLVTGIYPIPSAGSVCNDLVLFLHAFTPLITFGLICNSFHLACFVNSSLRFLIPNLHPICTCSCLFTPLTEGRSARDLTQAATSQKNF